jgi:FixJ family two-component response regulator
MSRINRVYVADGDAFWDHATPILEAAGFMFSRFHTTEDLLRSVTAEDVCCVVCDVLLAGFDPCCFLEAVAERTIYVPVIFVAIASPVETIVRTIKAGAMDFLLKPHRPGDLLDAIMSATRQHDIGQAQRLAFESMRRRYKMLTKREQEIFWFVVQGMLNKQISGELGISEKTVKVHRARMMKKFEVRSVAELARLSERFLAPTTLLAGPISCSRSILSSIGVQSGPEVVREQH